MTHVFFSFFFIQLPSGGFQETVNFILPPELALSYTRLFSVTLVTGSGFVRAERNNVN